MNIGMIMLNQRTIAKQNYVIWILIVFAINIFTKDLFENINNDVERWR